MPKGICFNTGRTHFKKGHGMNKGSKNPMWTGGRWARKDGYVFVLKHGHPMARPSGYVFEHRLVMSEHLKRTLLKNEIVHHINGIRNDNRIENLKLMTHSEHSSLHWNKQISHKCIICSSDFKDSPSRKRKFCSMPCFRSYRRGLSIGRRSD